MCSAESLGLLIDSVVEPCRKGHGIEKNITLMPTDAQNTTKTARANTIAEECITESHTPAAEGERDIETTYRVSSRGQYRL